MRRMPSQIELYEEMSLLSSRMVDAARASDWDNLIELERGVSSLRKALMATPEDCNAARSDLARKRSLIKCILDDDAEVRRHTEPWMERVRQFIGDGERLRDLQKVYAASIGASSRGDCGP